MQFGGIMLHRELRNLQEAGLSPMEVIVAATREAAIALGMADALGTIQRGKLADVVIVDRDPCIDLRHLREIAHVIKGGTLVDTRNTFETPSA